MQSKSTTLVNPADVQQQLGPQLVSRQLHTHNTAEEGIRNTEGSRLVPSSILALFEGGPFDAGYNKKYKPIQFQAPCGTQKVVLEAVITGDKNLLLCIAEVIAKPKA